MQRIRSSDREALEEFWSTPKVIVVAWSDRAIEATTEILIATACLTTFTRRSVCVCVSVSECGLFFSSIRFKYKLIVTAI